MKTMKSLLAGVALLASLGASQALAEVTVLGWPGGPEETALRKGTMSESTSELLRARPSRISMFTSFRATLAMCQIRVAGCGSSYLRALPI